MSIIYKKNIVMKWDWVGNKTEIMQAVLKMF